MDRKYRKVVPGLVIGAFAVIASPAQDFDLSWHTVDGGGAIHSTGGNFELSGTIGQPDTGADVLTGGEFELTGGFWPGTCFLLGDLDHNGAVNISDLAQLLGNYGTTSGATYEDGDLDGDGDVELPDLAALLGVYGTVCW
jgi:hypothetical protein